MKKILLVITMLLSSASLNAWKACYVEYGKLGRKKDYIQTAEKNAKAIFVAAIEKAKATYDTKLKEIKCKPSDGKNWRLVGRQTCGEEAGGVCCCHN